MAFAPESSRQYDPFKSRFRSSLKWLVALVEKLEGNSIDDLDIVASIENPHVLTIRLRVEVRADIAALLAKGDLYCRASKRLFADDDSDAPRRVIQALSRRGFYVVYGDDETPVTEDVLARRDPLEETAHLALIDALMMAYMNEVVSVEKVVNLVKQFGAFNASKELPFDLEDSLLLWVNKVCQNYVRMRGQTAHKPIDVLPMEDLAKDLHNGQCLGVLISFYRPDLLELKDLVLCRHASDSDVDVNIQLIQKACRRAFSHLSFPTPLTTDDLKRASFLLRPNIIAFITQLFELFVNQRESSNARAPPPPPPKNESHPAFWDHVPLERPKKESTALENTVHRHARSLIVNQTIDKVKEMSVARSYSSPLLCSPANVVQAPPITDDRREAISPPAANALSFDVDETAEAALPSSSPPPRASSPVSHQFEGSPSPLDEIGISPVERNVENDDTEKEEALDNETNDDDNCSEERDDVVDAPLPQSSVGDDAADAEKEPKSEADRQWLLAKWEMGEIRRRIMAERRREEEEQFKRIKKRQDLIFAEYLHRQKAQSANPANRLDGEALLVETSEDVVVDLPAIAEDLHIENVADNEQPELVQMVNDLDQNDGEGEKPVGFFVETLGTDKISQEELERRKERFMSSRQKSAVKPARQEAEKVKETTKLDQDPPKPSEKPSEHHAVATKPLVERQSQEPTSRHFLASAKSTRAESGLGPLRVKMTTKSNKQLIHNAVCHVCLAGAPNTELKVKALQALENSTGDHFVVLFRSNTGCKFRGIYVFNPENNQVTKIFGKGPKVVGRGMVDSVMKYNSGSRSFQIIQTKEISLTIDGFTIPDYLWAVRPSKPPI